MGLLDDAIREHLDLKRRHGASDDEIAQKEAEALGPARREFPRTAEEDMPVDEEAAQVDDDSFHTLGDPLEEEISEPPVFEPSPGPETAVESPPSLEPAPAPRAELADTEEYRFEDEELDEEDDDDLGLDEDDDDVELDDDDLGLDDDDEEEEEEDEDLLGDTPDFLQDTPEHDRLWFEQKPPRDFDFE
jgi:hypothetical protein